MGVCGLGGGGIAKPLADGTPSVLKLASVCIARVALHGYARRSSARAYVRVWQLWLALGVPR